MRAVLELEGLGARVEVLSGDAADEPRMREIVASARRRHGAIHGVIHAAGIPGGGSIQLTSPERAAATLDPKVKGTLVLEAALEDQPLDFFMLCSSINSMYAGPRSVDYCSANAFLDAFAHSRRGSGRGVVAINWDRWQEVGMAANAPVSTELQEAHARVMATGILPLEGVEAFERIVGTGLPQVVVSTRDLQFLLYVQQVSLLQAAQQGAQGTAGDAAGPSTDGGVRHPRPELANPHVAPRDDDERRIAAIWGALLGIEDIGVHDNFFELGGHSLLATRVLARLQDSVGVVLPLETIFDAPTVAKMAERVATLRWVTEANNTDKGDQSSREEFEL
jgi:acyl carrier protein